MYTFKFALKMYLYNQSLTLLILCSIGTYNKQHGNDSKKYIDEQ
jgi:hypothetical protein